jgi:hypothetical protein
MLTEIEKRQIRYMVSCNPTIENMERIGSLTDTEVLAELEVFKSNELFNIEQQINETNQTLDYVNTRMEVLENKKQILESEELDETV